MAQALTLEAVNRMSPAAFSQAFGAIFEHSPWIAERAFVKRPFPDADALHAAMKEVVLAASAAEQLALLRAHPELAGREARADALTAHSRAEQAGAGLDALSPAEMQRIAQLNARHAERFGFPFIIAVRLHDKAEIFAAFERRLALDPDEQRKACLEQVFLITALRLRDALGH